MNIVNFSFSSGSPALYPLLVSVGMKDGQLRGMPSAGYANDAPKVDKQFFARDLQFYPKYYIISLYCSDSKSVKP
jgi:hypothetical protein